MVVLGLCDCAQASSSCGGRLLTQRLLFCGARAPGTGSGAGVHRPWGVRAAAGVLRGLSCSTDVGSARTRVEPVLPALAGRVLPTEAPGRSLSPSLVLLCYGLTSFLSVAFGFLFHYLLYISYRLLPSGYLEETITFYLFTPCGIPDP